MALKDIREDLARKDSEYAKRGHRTTKYNEWQTEEDRQEDGSLWQRARFSIAGSQYKAVIIGALVVFGLLVLAFVVGAFVQYQRWYYAQERVELSVKTVAETPSNRAVEVEFEYYNNNRATLSNAEIVVQFGAYFVPAEDQEHFIRTDDLAGVMRIGEIAGGESKKLTLIGHFVAPEQETEVIVATLDYSVRGTARENRADTVVKITTSPLVVDILAPQTMISGNTIDIKAFYRNRGTEPIEDVSMIIDLPKGFLYRDASPRPEGREPIWELGVVEPEEQGEISVRGILEGESADIKSFSADLVRTEDQRVVFAGDTHRIQMQSSPITLTQTARGIEGDVARPGSRIEYTVTFKNDSSISLRDVILRAYIDGTVISLEDLVITNQGFYDPGRRFIEWKAADLPALKVLTPGESGSVQFTVSVRSHVPLSEGRDENLTVSSLVEMESLDLPDVLRENKNVFSNTHITKIGTKLLFDIDTERISGAYPLEVGEMTRYRVTMKAGTVNNDLGNAMVKMLLPSGVTFARQDENSDRHVEFNPRTNELSWNIGSLEHGTGVTSAYESTTFEIDVTRSINESGKFIPMLTNIIYSGEDQFTDLVEVMEIRDRDAHS